MPKKRVENAENPICNSFFNEIILSVKSPYHTFGRNFNLFNVYILITSDNSPICYCYY